MFSVFEFKPRNHLSWEDLPYLQHPTFARNAALKGIIGRDPYRPQVINIEQFREREMLHYDPFWNHDHIVERLDRLFFQGMYFSVSRNGIPFAPIYQWRAIEDHPDQGEWHCPHPFMGMMNKKQLNDLANQISARRRWNKAAAEEEAASALAPIVTAVLRREKNPVKVEAPAPEKTNQAAPVLLDKPKSSQPQSLEENEPLKLRKESLNNNAPTQKDIDLAKSEGSSAEHIAARDLVARNFLENNKYSISQINQAIGSVDGELVGGVDLMKPLEIVSFPPPDTMTQYVMPHGFPGNWFDPIGGQTPGSLGINGNTRTLTDFKIPSGLGLKSYSKPILDTWTEKSNPVQTEGGGKQLFVNDEIQKEVIRLNIKGN